MAALELAALVLLAVQEVAVVIQVLLLDRAVRDN
jgi:hypothetical protein